MLKGTKKVEEVTRVTEEATYSIEGLTKEQVDALSAVLFYTNLSGVQCLYEVHRVVAYQLGGSIGHFRLSMNGDIISRVKS